MEGTMSKVPTVNDMEGTLDMAGMLGQVVLYLCKILELYQTWCAEWVLEAVDLYHCIKSCIGQF